MTLATLAFIQAALQLAPLVISAGTSLVQLAESVYAVANAPGDPTDADWANLTAIETALRAQIEASIVPAAQASLT